LILGNLDCKPGDIVVESGTGSGSLSTSIARAIMPTGRLFTFEFNAKRAETAREEFALNRLPITCEHRDIIADGFRHQDYELADSLFLDIPNPWEAIDNVVLALKPGGYFANFSPCIEQVQKACLRMEALGFANIRTFETLSRPFHHVDMKGIHGKVKGHTGYLTFAVFIGDLSQYN
jgi:tRNA (adenine57-N1/adenine58-N1)-methyltransferase